MSTSIPTFSSADPSDVDGFYGAFFGTVEAEPEEVFQADFLEPLDLDDLIGIDPSLPDLIRLTLKEKRHLIIHGPPGTGKTTIARRIADALGSEWVLVTGTSDWTAHEVIGGYMPDAKGGLRFAPGLILSNFDKAVIIDEFNRADVDKAFGPLFSVLSDQPVALPYLSIPADESSPNVEILPVPVPDAGSHQYAPSSSWRLICTLNTYDKASLFQMSYALSRRFGWIYVDVPTDLGQFVKEFAAQRGWDSHPLLEAAVAGEGPTIARIWAHINRVRRIGPAPIIDVLEICYGEFVSESAGPGSEQTNAWRPLVLDALGIVVVPQMEGISEEQGASLAEDIVSLLQPAEALPEFDRSASRFRVQLTIHTV